MNVENQRLKEMLTQVTGNYNALQMHLVTLMAQQQHEAESTQRLNIVEAKPEEKKKQDAMVPRQFIELGPSPTTLETDELSHSSSDERTRSGSPPRNIEAVSNHSVEKEEIAPFDHNSGKRLGRDESPDSDGWGLNKAQKLNNNSSSKGIDHQSATTEANMRKARVSVRARSEAPMVINIIIMNQSLSFCRR